MALRCILHVGMPKTGSSSIQESLYFGLRASGFQYVSQGLVNGGPLMTNCFALEPLKNLWYQRLGMGSSEVASSLGRSSRLLDEQVARSRARKETLVISAEYCWTMTEEEFAGIADYFRQRGYEVEVFAYIRTWKSWLESRLQEDLKQGARDFGAMMQENERAAQIETQLAILDRVFGRDRVFPARFAPDDFPGRCVVQDFCSRTGIPLSPERIIRVNEGLSLSALKLLFAQRQFGGGYGTGLQAMVRNEILVRRLLELPGPAVRLHSSLVKPFLEEWQGQTPAIERRLGVAFQEDIHRYDQGECLRDLSELSECSAESLDWLARVTGLPRVAGASGPVSGTDASRAVGQQVQYLLEHPSLGSRLAWHRMIASRRLAHWLHGV